MTNQEQHGGPLWDWPDSDEPVDLSPFVLREWTEHHGDSPITLARPRKRRGAASTPEPAYLLKKVRCAIGERVYYLVARQLDLPSSVVRWTDYAEAPVAAIRFEPAAWRPDELDVELATAQLGDRIEQLVNPHDAYRHDALYAVLDEDDDTEYMVRDGVLFRIDAAAAGDALWGEMVMAAIRTTSDSQPKPFQGTEPVSRNAESQRKTPQGYAAYMGTLARIAAHPEWDELVANDLRNCPARSFGSDTHEQLPLDELTPAQQERMRAWFDVPLMEHIADTFLGTMTRKRAVIQSLLDV